MRSFAALRNASLGIAPNPAQYENFSSRLRGARVAGGGRARLFRRLDDDQLLGRVVGGANRGDDAGELCGCVGRRDDRGQLHAGDLTSSP